MRQSRKNRLKKLLENPDRCLPKMRKTRKIEINQTPASFVAVCANCPVRIINDLFRRRNAGEESSFRRTIREFRRPSAFPIPRPFRRRR